MVDLIDPHADIGLPCHIGHIVPDLRAAMEHYSSAFGLEWASVQVRRGSMRVNGSLIATELTITWSVSGPVHFELIEESPGSPWTVASGHPIHHIAYPVDDLAAAVDSARSKGYELEVTRDGDAEVNGIAYLTSPFGLRVEFMDTAVYRNFQRWLNGGELI